MPDNSQQNYFNAQAASLAAQVANQAAQLEFQRQRFAELEKPQFEAMTALEKEKLAFQKATEVWNQAFQEASVTGAYNGVPAAQYLLSAAQLTGQFYQPGQLNASQQNDYQIIQQEIAAAQQQLMTLAVGTPEYQAAAASLASARAKLAPLQQILQGTDKPPIQTLAAQNQQFQQQLALAGLTGMVPTALGSPTGAAPTGTPTIDTNSPQYADIQARLAAGAITAEQAAAEWEAALQASIPTTPGAPGGTAGGTPTMAYLQMLAQLTGQFNGQPTPEYQQMLAALTGQFNGQPTQAAMEFAKQFGLSEAAVTGMYNGQPTQAAQEFAKQFGLSEAAVTGMYQGSPTQAAKEFQQNLALQQQTMENSQANQLLQLAASLRGPRNAFQFAKTLGGTPQGLSDILATVAGRYMLPSYQGGGAAPEPVTLQNFMQDTYAATPAGQSLYQPQMSQWSTPAPAYTVNPPGAQAPTNAFNYQPVGDGSQTVYPPGISAPVQAGQVSSAAPMSQANLQNIGAQAMAQQPYMLPRPSQLNAENYANLGSYRQDLLKAAYENQGWDVQAFEDQFKASLPTYSGPKVGKIAGIV